MEITETTNKKTREHEPEWFRVLYEQEQRELTQAWGDFLRRYRWTHVATLTFKNPTGIEGAWKAFHVWKRELARWSQGKVFWFAAIERTSGSMVHIHALIQVDGLSPGQLKKAWRKGYSKVQGYDPSRGWAYYAAKEIGGPVVDYNLEAGQPFVLAA